MADLADTTWKIGLTRMNRAHSIATAIDRLLETDEAHAVFVTSKSVVDLTKARARNAGVIVVKTLVEQVRDLQAVTGSGKDALAKALVEDFLQAIAPIEGLFVKGSVLPLRETERERLRSEGVVA
jgi:c-di-AMP phosphodiesterase-like protein